MQVEKIDHIHIYVRDLEAAICFFSGVLGTRFSEPSVVEVFQLRSSLEPLGLELIESTSPEGVVAHTIQRRGEGVAAISFKVPDIEAAKAELQARGLRLVGELETGGLKEAQFHPKDSFGVMIELCEYEQVHPVVPALHRGG